MDDPLSNNLLANIGSGNSGLSPAVEGPSVVATRPPHTLLSLPVLCLESIQCLSRQLLGPWYLLHLQDYQEIHR